jgi:serine/threonine protein kinase
MHSAGRTADATGPVTSELAARYLSLFGVGRGGMGQIEVALARGPAGFERVVALKRLLPDAARIKRHTDMFLREARLATLLEHPNVAHAFEFGELGGEYFLAMEYIEGETLSRVLHVARHVDGGLPPVVVAHILALACDGLHAAHELCDTTGTPLNVVHRDVSPLNVMVSYDGLVKLLDFGVAKIDTMESLTKTGEIKGKTRYMSPEQAMGDPLDRRSDLYSVGALLFECITGRKMWEGTDMDVLRHLAIHEPPRLEEGRADTPPELCDLYNRLVSRPVDGRPASAREVADELRAFVAKSNVLLDTPTMKAMMTRLFGEEIARRREALSASLHDHAPAEASALERSILGYSSVPPGPVVGSSNHIALQAYDNGGPTVAMPIEAMVPTAVPVPAPAPPPILPAQAAAPEKSKAMLLAVAFFLVLVILACVAIIVLRLTRRPVTNDNIENIEPTPPEPTPPLPSSAPTHAPTFGPVPILPSGAAPAPQPSSKTPPKKPGAH